MGALSLKAAREVRKIVVEAQDIAADAPIVHHDDDSDSGDSLR